MRLPGRPIAILCLLAATLAGAETLSRPFSGVTHIHRTETEPRPVSMHLLKVDLSAPGLSFKLTPGGGGSRETVRQRTVDFLNQEHAQAAINAHFFLPFPSAEPDADLVGLAASGGVVYSNFEAPVQSYALVANAPALNIDSHNRAAIVGRDSHGETLWTAVSGSAQIVTGGKATIPVYADEDHPDGQLTPGGPGNYSNAHSWYEATNARTIIGLSRDNRTLFLFTIDNAGGSKGLKVSEAAELLIRDYGVWNALNLDGGGSTTLAMENSATHSGEVVNHPSDHPLGRAVGSSLAVFARGKE